MTHEGETSKIKQEMTELKTKSQTRSYFKKKKNSEASEVGGEQNQS